MHNTFVPALETYRIDPEDLRGLLTPALVIFMDYVEANIRRMLELVGGGSERWRPHMKTIKTPLVFARLAKHGIRCFKCATTREANVLLSTLAENGAEEADLLVAYPHIGPALVRLGEIAGAHPRSRVSVLCEDPAAVDAIPPELSIFVDVNPDMNRTGVPLADRSRVVEIARRAGGRFRGLHCYEGHLTQPSPQERRARAFDVYDRLMGLVEEVRRHGQPIDEIVTSGTPAFPHALAYPRFAKLEATRHSVSPGTVVFHDARSAEDQPELQLTPAVAVLSRVVSHPADDIITCDTGSKSIAVDVGIPCAVVVEHPGLEQLPPSEEHLPFRVASGRKPARGEMLLLIPRHVCPTVNLAEEAVIVEGGRVTQVVPVAARAHETMRAV